MADTKLGDRRFSGSGKILYSGTFCPKISAITLRHDRRRQPVSCVHELIDRTTMNDLQKEISELKQFIVDLKADRSATKEKDKREAWTKYVSLTVVIIAVMAAVATQWGGKYSSRTQMSQVQASDQWAFYQAKSIKQHVDEVTLVQLTRAGSSNDVEMTKTIKKLTDALARYDKEKAEIKAKAEGLEAMRDDASKRSGKIGVAISYFTVAIATASICTVTKKKPLWFVSIALAAVAAVQMVMAWMM